MMALASFVVINSSVSGHDGYFNSYQYNADRYFLSLVELSSNKINACFFFTRKYGKSASQARYDCSHVTCQDHSCLELFVCCFVKKCAPPNTPFSNDGMSSVTCFKPIKPKYESLTMSPLIRFLWLDFFRDICPSLSIAPAKYDNIYLSIFILTLVVCIKIISYKGGDAK